MSAHWPRCEGACEDCMRDPPTPEKLEARIHDIETTIQAEQRELQDIVVEYRAALYAAELNEKKFGPALRKAKARLLNKGRELTVFDRRCLDHSNTYAKKIGVR